MSRAADLGAFCFKRAKAVFAIRNSAARGGLGFAGAKGCYRDQDTAFTLWVPLAALMQVLARRFTAWLVHSKTFGRLGPGHAVGRIDVVVRAARALCASCPFLELASLTREDPTLWAAPRQGSALTPFQRVVPQGHVAKFHEGFGSVLG